MRDTPELLEVARGTCRMEFEPKKTSMEGDEAAAYAKG